MAIAYASRAVEAAAMVTLSSDSSRNGRTSHTGKYQDDTVGLGELLRRAREGCGLTLEQISNETKIPHRHLEALEHDNVAVVPVEFYRRAEIRAYARAVRLDQNVVLAELERLSRPPVVREAIVPWPRAKEPTLFRKRACIAIGVVLAAAVLGRATGEREPAPDSRDRIPQRTQFDRVAPPSPRSDFAPAAAIEPDVVRPSAASGADLPATTDQGGAPVFTDSATELVVTTEPAGAWVTVDGIGWGITPVTIRYLPAGQKRIRVTKDGYATEDQMVRLAEGHPRTVDIQLSSAP